MDSGELVCRLCSSKNLTLILSLGKTPLANALLSESQLASSDECYPLDLMYCSECSLVQLSESVSPEKLFREYVYFSSFADTTSREAERLVKRMIEQRNLDQRVLVVEVASNDGYLLKHYHRRSIPVLGIEPAANIAQYARETNGVNTISEFFGIELANALRAEGKTADVIHANNVLAHVADLNGFVEGIRCLLKEDGIAVIEVPYVRNLIEHVEFDTIYHEHLCYFSLTALENLCLSHGLCIEGIERIPIHGGSLRLFVTKHLDHPRPTVLDLLEEEKRDKVDQLDFYRDFATRVQSLKHRLLALLQQLKAQGNRIVAYGASAKGSTLLNYCGIGRETLEFVVDRSTIKQGFFTPGSHLSIFGTDKLLEEMPDYVLLLTWNFAEEILTQQEEYRRRGGHFIIPIPELHVV